MPVSADIDGDGDTDSAEPTHDTVGGKQTHAFAPKVAPRSQEEHTLWSRGLSLTLMLHRLRL